ncbi:MAG: (Fe-S)-binding protein [Syntrophobacteraceae bacterium]|nr:(Fe-S)-binding protein [Syntrophobacteraceae bacterium]
MELAREQIDYCMECGVCTGSCPVSRVLPAFSPRQMIKRVLMDRDETVLEGRELWACLACARCSSRCPARIDFPEFIREYRETARKRGNLPQESHHGALQAIMSLQTRNLSQHRTDWAKEIGRFKTAGDIFFFVGCAPYFDTALKYGPISLEMAGSVLRLLNRMGIEPVVSDDERCCGHDALLSGDRETFHKLAAINLEVIAGAGAKTVLFSCPEGYVTFKTEIPKYFGKLPFEVIHVSQFLARELPGSGLSFRSAENGSGAITYQDPCSLGRKAGIYDPPRDLINMVPGVKFEEMARNRENSVCCGTSAWMECSECSKEMQVERLLEAAGAGASTLITACPKCAIHLSCAEQNTDITLKIKDLYSFLLDRVE